MMNSRALTGLLVCILYIGLPGRFSRRTRQPP